MNGMTREHGATIGSAPASVVRCTADTRGPSGAASSIRELTS